MIIGIDASRAFGIERTGTENYSYHLIKHLLRLPAARTHHFVLYTRAKAVIPEWVRGSKREVVQIQRRFLWTQVGLAAETWRRKLDVLWVPAHTLPVLRKPGLKTVVTIHGLEYQWLPEYKNRLQRWYLPLSTYYAAKYADRLIAVSEFTKRQLVELGTEIEKITVIYEGVDFSDIRNQRISDPGTTLAKFGLEEKKYILFVGTVQPRKNLVKLVEAYSKIKRDLPGLPAQAGIKLVVAGSRGWMTEEIYQAPRRYGVADSVVFTGRVSEQELRVLYAQAAIYVQPSLQEGFGLPVLEAMRAGTPVITSDGGALPEIVGEAGMIVPLTGRQFVARLAGAMRQLVADSAKGDRLAAAAKKRVKDFGWTKAASETLEVLLNC